MTATNQKQPDLSQINQEKYNDSGYLHSFIIKQKEFQKINRHLLYQIKSIINPPGKMLDVGCGLGLFLKEAQNHGWDCQGIESAKQAVQFARKTLKLKVISGDFNQLKFKEQFDVVTFLDVLEHLPKPQQSLAKIYQISKPNGIVVIQCPNINSYSARLAKKNWFWLMPPWHLWHFSPKSLNHLLEKHHFKVIQQYTWEPYYSYRLALSNRLVNNSKNLLSRMVKLLVFIVSVILYPILKIIQIISWKKMKGALLVTFAQKEP
jgi:ubiquinone/menaquinone biosynthesis C-methylase UbiE